MSGRAIAKGKKETDSQRQHRLDDKADTAVRVACLPTRRPRPDWMLDKDLLPRAPPGGKRRNADV